MIFNLNNGLGIGVQGETIPEIVDKMVKEINTMTDKADYKVYVDGTTVKVVRKDGKTETARCHPDDEFDVGTGIKVAIDKMQDYKFKVGTVVIGNTKAGERYNYTGEGFIGLVTDNFNHNIIEIKELNSRDEVTKYRVNGDCFDLYKPKAGDCVKLIPYKLLDKDLQLKNITQYELDFGLAVVVGVCDDGRVSITYGHNTIKIDPRLIYPVKF